MNNLENKPKWMTIGQAAKYLGVSRDTLRRWEVKGKVKAVRSPTNRRYYTQKQLDRIMGSKTEAPEPAKKSKTAPAPKNNLRVFLIGLASLLAAAVLGFLAQVLLLK